LPNADAGATAKVVLGDFYQEIVPALLEIGFGFLLRGRQRAHGVVGMNQLAVHPHLVAVVAADFEAKRAALSAQTRAVFKYATA